MNLHAFKAIDFESIVSTISPSGLFLKFLSKICSTLIKKIFFIKVLQILLKNFKKNLEILDNVDNFFTDYVGIIANLAY